MDFFDQQDKARKQTGVLVFYFCITVVSVVLTVYLAIVGIVSFLTRDTELPIRFLEFHPKLFFAVVGVVVTTIIAGTLYKIMELGGDGARVATELGGTRVPPNTHSLSERVLLNVVEEMAIASGTPVPPVYILYDETGINAFAAGTSPQNAVIGITRGAVETLSRDELQGVIAHEFSHILNGDMKLNVRLIGLLYGIMLIAMIGYLILRIGIEVPVRGSSDDDGKGALAFLAVLFAIGGALIGIGYLGVFFANLIQAAVSRQREFLADASAVQFTRNPTGLAGALKRIGGWKDKSSLRAVHAREASHMFFGQGLASQWFATHPPLITRIRRLDPNFSGSFEKTEFVHHSEQEVVDPRAFGLAMRSPSSSAHTAALAGVDRFEQAPQEAVQYVGDPAMAHIDHAHDLVQEIDPRLIAESRDPLGAISVLYAMLLSVPQSEARAAQLIAIQGANDARIVSELNRVIPIVDAMLVEHRLPVACMLLPALTQLSEKQTNVFQRTVRQLIDWDRQWTIFEFAIQRFITRRLVFKQRDTSTGRKANLTFSSVQPDFAIVLSTLAHFGADDSPEKAFLAGVAALGESSTLQLIPKDRCTLRVLDGALNQLECAIPSAKKQMLSAFSACIAQDGHASITEAELLRVISDALGCPMPPILDLQRA